MSMNMMKIKMTRIMKLILNLACVAATVVILAACASEGEGHEHEGDLKAQAKISEADARAAVLAKVPDAKIKEGELEKEHGRLIWSFDIAKPNVANVSEVNVDANTGEIVNMEKNDKD